MTGGPLDGTSYPLPLTGGQAIVGWHGRGRPDHARQRRAFPRACRPRPRGPGDRGRRQRHRYLVNGEKVEGSHALQDRDRVCPRPAPAPRVVPSSSSSCPAPPRGVSSARFRRRRAIPRRAARDTVLRGGADSGVLQRRRARRGAGVRPVVRGGFRRAVQSSSKTTSRGRRSRPTRSSPRRTKATRSSPPRCRPPLPTSRPGPPPLRRLPLLLLRRRHRRRPPPPAPPRPRRRG